jgi:hypothetical protein
MALNDYLGPVLLSSGRWVRSDVRRFPRAPCPVCTQRKSLRRNHNFPVDHPRGWEMGSHNAREGPGRCAGVGVTVTPAELPPGWLDPDG